MGKKKDVLFLCQFFHPEYISSAQLPFDTALALKEAGFTVDALVGYPKEYARDRNIPLRETVDGIGIHRLKYIQLNRKGFLSRLVNYFSFTAMVLLHLPEIARYRSVIVYSNPPILPWVASWAKALFGTKLVFVAYDLYPEMAVVTNSLRQGSVICRLMEHINKVVYRRCDRVVALSSEMKDYILPRRDIDPDHVAVIPNWYADKGALKPDKENNRFAGIAAGRFVVSYLGNMGTVQDMQTILDAIRLMKDDPDVFFLFAGHGNKMEKLRQSVAEEKLQNIVVYDFLHGQDFQDALAISDCAMVSLEKGLTGTCVPSKTYSNMMQGIPLLAVMDESDIVQDIEKGAGMWVRNGEAEKLADSIRYMRQNPAAHEAMRRTCREIFLEKYTTQICTGKYVDVFRQLLEGEAE